MPCFSLGVGITQSIQLLGYVLNDEWFDSQQVQEVFFFKTSELSLGPTQLVIQWGTAACPTGINQPGHEVEC
jgi:hypothetical protein